MDLCDYINFFSWYLRDFLKFIYIFPTYIKLKKQKLFMAKEKRKIIINFELVILYYY